MNQLSHLTICTKSQPTIAAANSIINSRSHIKVFVTLLLDIIYHFHDFSCSFIL